MSTIKTNADCVFGPIQTNTIDVFPPGNLIGEISGADYIDIGIPIDIDCVDAMRAAEFSVNHMYGPGEPVAVIIFPPVDVVSFV
ncbi:hypothetical protein BMS3Bbin04_01378 [bacterium BMS3Bbin04]|nr:hypothetical protein BMS3Bbin04_01378 [bacterium BMS3Bbin04]